MRPRAGVVALTLLAAACGDGGGSAGSVHVPAATELVGSYDLTTTRDDHAAAGVARVGVTDDGELGLALSDPPVALHGRLQHDGTIAVTGETTNSDAISVIQGTASVQDVDGILRIGGTLDDGSAFTLERASDADQSGASGRYRLTAGSYSYVIEPTFFELSAGDVEITRLGARPAR